MWAFTVRSLIPRGDPISLLERPATSNSRTSFSRSVKEARPAGKALVQLAVQRTLLVNEFRFALIDLLVDLADGSLEAFDLLCRRRHAAHFFTCFSEITRERRTSREVEWHRNHGCGESFSCTIERLFRR